MTESTSEQLLKRIGEAHPQRRLSAMRRLVELLGDVHQCAPVIHLTGTNGKTSTSRMIEALVRAHGLRTGLLTSPHLVDLTERIVVDGEPISHERLDDAWAELAPVLDLVDAELAASDEPAVSFFEAVTALGFVVFADAPVDVMILEVGMGGEWDATNVADAAVAVFTPIDLDHTRQLGESIAEIAATKAGIIKQGSLVVSAAQPAEAMVQILKAAEACGSQVVVEHQDFAVVEALHAVGGQLVALQGVRANYEELAIALLGDHQAQNAAVALAAVELFLAEDVGLRVELVREGFAAASSPGRCERVSHDPVLFVDAAHNPHGMRALAETLSLTFPGHTIGVLFGALNDKDVSGMAEPLGAIAETFFITAPQSSRAMQVHDCANAVRDALPDATVLERDSLVDGLESLRDWVREDSDRVGIITGSVVLVGEVLQYARAQRWS